MGLSAEFTVQGNPNPAEHLVSYGDTVNLALLSINGAEVISCEIVGTAFSTDPIPVVTLGGIPLGSTASFVMPADPGDGFGRTFRVKYRVSNELESDEKYGIVGAVNDSDLLPLTPGEDLDRNRTHGWTEVINRALNGSGGGGPTSLGGDVIGNVGATTTVKIHGATVTAAGAVGTLLLVTGVNVLGYALLTNANVDPAASIAGTKVAPAFGAQNISTTGTLASGAATVTGLTVSGLGQGIVHSSAGGVFSSSLVVNADVSASAAIAVTKLAAGPDGQFLTNVAGVPTWGPATVGTGSVAPGTNGQFFVTAAGASGWGTAAGDVTGAVTALVVGRINGATVPIAGGLTTGHVLQASGVAALSYGFIANANVDAAAAIAGTKISPNFGSQNVLTSGTLGAGATTVTSLTASVLGLGIVHSSSGGVFSSSTIVNADVDAAAAIATTKIAHGTANQFFVTNGAGTANAFATSNGDWTGAVDANVVGRINGTAVTTPGGSILAGQSLRATAGATSDWGPINLANANAVANNLAVTHIAPSAADGDVLTTVAGVTAWAAATGIAPFNSVNNGGARTLLGISAHEFATVTDRTVVFVMSMRAFFRWVPTSTGTHDVVNYVQPTVNGVAAGRFERMPIADRSWMDQFTWVVKPSTGNDENSGVDAANALATQDEMVRRMGPDPEWHGTTTYHLHILEDITRLRLRVLRTRPGETTTAVILIHGSMTPGAGISTPIYSGTIDNTPVQTPSTNTRFAITSNGLATAGGWTTQGLICESANKGKRIRLTSGANAGAVMWAGKDNAGSVAKQAFINEPRGGGNAWTSGVIVTNTCTPANGDNFVVENLVVVSTIDVAAAPQAIVIFESLRISAAGQLARVNVVFDGCYTVFAGRPVFAGVAERIRYNGCFVEGASSNEDCYPLAECINFTNCAQVFGTSNRVLQGGSVTRHVIFGQIAGQMQLDGPKSVSGADDATLTARSRGWAVWSLAQFDCPGAPMLMVANEVQFGSSTVLWGSGNSFGPIVLLANAGITMANGGDPPFAPLPASWFYYDISGGVQPWVALTLVGNLGDGRLVGHQCPAYDYETGLWTELRNLTPANLNAPVETTGFNGQFRHPFLGCYLLQVNQG